MRPSDLPHILTPEEVEAHQSACKRLLNAAPVFQQKYDSVAAGLNHLEVVYKHEKDAQERLLATAQKME
jgi:hypothetical protein